MHTVLLLCSSLIAMETLCAQVTTARKEFEVASIRDVPDLTPEARAASDPNTRRPQISKGYVTLPYESMAQILQQAFALSRPQLVAPGWTENRHFSIAAKLPAGAAKDDVPEMLKNLLLSRFHLAYHTKVRKTLALVLTSATAGIKAEPLAAQSRPRGRPIIHGGIHYELATTSAGFAEFLQECTFSPVIDRTGLLGSHLFSFDFYPFGKLDGDGIPLEPPSGDFLADLVRHYHDAVAPLGLRLAPSKIPLENVIVDHLDREPTEN